MNLNRLFLFLVMLSASGKTLAGPFELSYGGRLTDSSGKPVVGAVDLDIGFYRTETGDDEITAVTIPPFNSTLTADGIFQVKLTLTPSEFHTIFNASDSVWIQVKDVSHGRTYPRQIFSAVPYALKVPVSGSSITYNTNGELVLGNGANILTLPSVAGATNKVLKSNGAGGLIWADDLTAGANSVTSTDIQDDTIVNADIATNAAIATSKLSGSLTAVAGHGLGTAAMKNVGTAASEVAAGDHGHADATTTSSGFLSGSDKVRLNAAVTTTDVGSITSAMIADNTIANADVASGAAIATSKLSGAVTAIAGHGLGNAAAKDVGSGANDVAAGNHSHASATTSAAGFLSASDKTRLDAALLTTDTSVITSAMITDDSITNADVKTNAAIAGTKISPNFGAQDVQTTGNVNGANVSASGFLQTGLTTGAPAGTACDSSSKYGRIQYDSAAAELYLCSSSGWQKIATPRRDYILVVDEKTAGTNGGSSAAGSWLNRDLNTVKTDTGSNVTLASNVMTFKAGTYECDIRSPANKSNNHRARLYSDTTSSVVLWGTSMSDGNYPITTHSVIQGRFTLATDSALRVQHYTSYGTATTGLGVADNISGAEVYTTVQCYRIN